MDVSRDLRKETFWRKLVRAQARSGLGVRAFCRERGERESAFYWWRSELARSDAARGGDERSQASALAPVHVIADTSPAVEIVVAGGRVVRVSGPVDRALLSDVLAVLEERGC